MIAEFAENANPSEDVGSRAAFVQMAHDAGSDMFARQSDATLTRSDRWPTLATSTIPTLLIWGKADHFVPVDVGLRIAKLMPHARFESLEGCGHFPTLERPSLCTDISRNWLIERKRSFCGAHQVKATAQNTRVRLAFTLSRRLVQPFCQSFPRI
ncbi:MULTISPECIES: alpha/beta fold hydrolase [Burkholderia cepacia complex]|uniref:alpha/beta fold hydrolase n=1 Tax=Burkholderia cepacia complex TaxID=87882 RepID=UPI001E2BF10D|nr:MULTISPECIES: alpha/beta hydrolase [Burkholderia cepacia complex]